MAHLADELVRLAHVAASDPGTRAELAAGLTAALAVLAPDAQPRTCPLLTRRVANAIDGVAASLTLAADHATCIAEEAAVILTSRDRRPHG